MNLFRRCYTILKVGIMRKIRIIPIGDVDQRTLGSLAESLWEIYRCETIMGERASIPEKSYNSLRKQYNSTRILKDLENIKVPAGELILGVIDKDLYVSELNFVFGEADVLARIALIGLPRLRQDADEELFQRRVAKEAVHELGHTCGLGHCPDRKCVMHFSNSLQDTDVKEALFCAVCRIKMEAAKKA